MEERVCTRELLKIDEDQVLLSVDRREGGDGNVAPTGELEPDALDGEMMAVPHNAQLTCMLCG